MLKTLISDGGSVYDFQTQKLGFDAFSGLGNGGSLYLSLVTSRVLYLISAHTYPCQIALLPPPPCLP